MVWLLTYNVKNIFQMLKKVFIFFFLLFVQQVKIFGRPKIFENKIASSSTRTTRYSPPRHHQQPPNPPVSSKGMGWGWVTKWDYGYVTNPVAGPPPPPKTCTAPKPKQHVSEDDWWNDILDDNENSISERFRGASKSYRTFDTIDRRMDVFAPARHTGQIYRGSIQNPELNSPKDRAFGSGSDFNPGDEISFRSAPRGQTLIVTKVCIFFPMKL